MATPTYTPIYTTTLSGNQSTVSFSSFGGYTDLRIVASIKLTGTNGLYFKPNSDTSSSYSATTLYGNGSGSASSRLTTSDLGGTGMYIPAGSFSTSTFSVLQIDLMNYTNTNVYKTALARYSTSDARVGTSVELYAKADAITTLVFGCDGGGSIASGSTFTLYGIANAVIGAAKATGGTITYDDTYYYHTFGASGTFTPTQSLTADVLVIAGGGAGATRYGGGGGAGGLCYKSSSSLTATAYTITVGAGGSGVSIYTIPSNSGSNSSISGSGFSTITANGGGYGGAASNDGTGNPASGGSGGGGGGYFAINTTGASSNQTGSGGSTGYGNSGGNGTANESISGGGGGAGAVGQNGSGSQGGGNAKSGNGGAGLSSSTLAALTNFGSTTGTGVNVSGVYYYAGGGGGGGRSDAASTTPGTGGLGGGGAGSIDYVAGGNGLTNTGGGGGGAWNGTTGSGGSGLVIIRYAKA